MLWDNVMRHWNNPLDLAAGIAPRLAHAAALVGLLWLAIGWAMGA